MHITLHKIQRGPTSKLIFSIVHTGSAASRITEPISIDNLALVRFRFDLVDDQFTLKPSVSIKKRSITTSDSVEIKITSPNFNLKTICSDTWTQFASMGQKLFEVFIDHWSRVGTTNSYILEVNITVLVKTPFEVNQILYNDTATTDFLLRTDHGAVAVHKRILVPHSEVFEAILTDDSEETEGHFAASGLTVQTLQHLKDYVYLNVLPDEGLQQLLLAATSCFMDKLRDACIVKLAETVLPENLDSLINFAMVNQIPDLMRALLHHTPDAVVNSAHEIRKRS